MQRRLEGAQIRLAEEEKELYVKLRGQLLGYVRALQEASEAVSEIDCLCSFADVSKQNQYVFPELTQTNSIYIKQGRHPCVERVLTNGFVANDVEMDKYKTIVLTGPNIAGKSTYLRQVALIVLLAQVGCFVPAKECKIGLMDKIFARIGAGDDLVGGKSTFMCEMSEVSFIVNNATTNSLVVLDEVGRGTSTADGYCLAQAVLEYITQNIRCNTLFSTHFHGLGAMCQNMNGVSCYKTDYSLDEEGISFLYTISRGLSEKS